MWCNYYEALLVLKGVLFQTPYNKSILLRHFNQNANQKKRKSLFVFSSSKLEKFFKLDEWKDSEQHSLLVIVGNNKLRIFIYLMLLKLNCMHFKEIKLQSVSSTVASHKSSCKQLAIMHHAANKWVARNFNNEGKTIHS